MKLATTVAASLALLAVATGAHAQAPANFTALPAGDVLLTQISSPFSITSNGQTTSGNLLSAVFSTTAGGRDFTYQFTSAASSSAPIATLSLSDFSVYPGTYFQSSTVDVDGAGAFTTGGDAATNSFTSSGTAFFTFAGVAAGGQSDTILIRTASPGFITGNGAVIAGASANAAILAPTASVVPEANTMALIGTGALGLLGMVRRRKITK